MSAEVAGSSGPEDYIARAKDIARHAEALPLSLGEKARADALLERMRDAGLLAACVPTSFGGPGLGVRDVARISFHLGSGSGSAGLIYAMHASQAFSVVRHGQGAYFEDFQRRMVRDQILIASGTSEKGPGGDILTSLCTVEQDDPPAGLGLRVVKESPNVSYVDHAGAILVTANHHDARGRPRQVLALAERENTHFEPGRDTQFLGMAGILNRPYNFTARFAADALFQEPFGAVARSTMTPTVQIFWAAMWSGIASHVLAKAKRFVSAEVPAKSELGGVVRAELTRLISKHYVMNALVRDAIMEYDVSGTRALNFGHAARINRLKIECSELLQVICRGALELVGIRGYALGGPYSLAEAVADAMSSPIMVSNTRLAMNNAKIENFIEETL